MPPPKGTTTELLAAIAGGKQDALKSLYDAQSARLFGLAMAILRDRPAASDALQESFVRVWQRAGQFDRTDSDPEAWLTAIARQTALELARARGREAPTDDPGLGDSAIDPEALDALPNDALRDHLRQLDPKVRQSVMLSFVHGLSHPELAARLNEPLGAIRSWVRAGLAGLREQS